MINKKEKRKKQEKKEEKETTIFFPKPELNKEQLKKNNEFKKLTASDNDITWEQDKKTYFTIMPFITKNKIYVRAYSTNHEQLYLITGTKPEQIYHKIIKKGLITKLEHAAYLGKELEKAYIAMKKKLRYNQDDEINWNHYIKPDKKEEKKIIKETITKKELPPEKREQIIFLNHITKQLRRSETNNRNKKFNEEELTTMITRLINKKEKNNKETTRRNNEINKIKNKLLIEEIKINLIKKGFLKINKDGTITIRKELF